MYNTKLDDLYKSKENDLQAIAEIKKALAQTKQLVIVSTIPPKDKKPNG